MLKKWRKSGLTFLSFFALAAILPVLMLGALNPEGLRFTSRADQPNELRIWFEPKEIITKPGIKLKVKIMAEFSESGKLIPKLEGVVSAENGLLITNPKIKFEQPFSGRVEVGEIEMEAKTVGQFKAHIDEKSIFTQLPDLIITTSSTNIISRKP